jgi:hypothetical protein
MQYLNLELSILDSVEFVGSEPVDQATWLKLQRYCAGQENGGIIRDCREWKDRKCQQLLRITRAEMLRECDLWTWDAGTLRIFAYPVEQEAKVIRKRDIARTNGQLGGRPPANPNGTDLGSQIGTDLGSKRESVKERKGKEGNEKEDTTTTAREVELLIAAYARPSHDREALEAAADCLRRHGPVFGFEKIRAAVATVTELVRDWPEDERVTYLPTAANFFRNDLWRRHSDEWRSRRDPKRRLADERRAGGKPALTDDERRKLLGGRADEDAA